jgi:hypothetical protein
MRVSNIGTAGDVGKLRSKSPETEFFLPKNVADKAKAIMVAIGATGLAAGQPSPAEAGTSAKDLRNSSKILERLKAILSGTGESRINLKRIKAKDSVKALLEQINASEAEALEESRRLLPHSKVIEQAKQIPIQDVLKADIEAFDSAALQTAARGYNVAATKRFERAQKKAMKGDEQAALDLLSSFPLAGQLSNIQERLGTITARALAARKIEVGGAFSQKGVAALYKQMKKAAEEATAGTEMARRRVVGFKTAKGSTYEIQIDGSTIRNKAPRPEHPGEFGVQPKSSNTYYVTIEDAQKLSEVQTKGGPNAEIAATQDGRIGVRYLAGKDAGKFERRTVVPHGEPGIEKVPVEVIPGKTPHFGNPITELYYEGGTSPRKATQAEGDLLEGLPALRGPEEVIDLREAMIHERKATQAEGDLLEGLPALRGPEEVIDLREAMIHELGQGDAVKAGMVLARRISVLTPQQMGEVAKESAGLAGKISDFFMTAWMNSILSGPQTHVANAVSNMGMTIWAPAERFLMAAADPTWLGDGREVFFGESKQMVYGLIESYKDAVKMTGRALKTGESSFGPSKMREMGSRYAGTLAEDTPWGSAGDYLRMALPTRWLTAGDEFWKILNLGMEMRALAWREARLSGKTGAEAGAYARNVLANPSKHPDIVEKAKLFALDQTMNGPMRGRIGAMAEGLLGMRAKVPILGFVFPFIRTPANSLQQGLERMPLINFASIALRDDLKAGGAVAAAARAKLATSGMIAAGLSTYAFTFVPGRMIPKLRDRPGVEGMEQIPYMTVITGSGPKDPKQRAMLESIGWKAYAQWNFSRGQYVQYGRFEPWGTTLGLIADMAEIYGNAPQESLGAGMGAFMVALSKYAENKTFLQGAANIMKVLDGQEKGEAYQLERWTRSMVGSIIPNFVAQANRELWDNQVKEIHSHLDMIKSRTPGYSDDVPPRRNLFGQEQMVSHGWIPGVNVSMVADLMSPFKVGRKTSDKPTPEEIAAAEISRLRMRVPGWPASVDGSKPQEHGLDLKLTVPGIPLDGWEKDTVAKRAGYGLTPGGMRMAEAIASEVQSTSYKIAPPLEKELRITAKINQYMQLAINEVRETPAIQKKLTVQRGILKELSQKTNQPGSPFYGKGGTTEQVNLQGEMIRQLGQSLNR